ncbi:hypothetical protein CPT34_29240 [Rhizobium sophoriradicis]|uniref:Uncharacterized protein n=1 Tax=Rhizobium sophoriradicis TaxID=1535245 RepID=A0A2A5KKQ7_9HYPH|nr:hypothetical protein CPT34_29240 [Rhizobium sophoriradicis]
MIAHDLPFCAILLNVNVAFAEKVASAVSACLPCAPGSQAKSLERMSGAISPPGPSFGGREMFIHVIGKRAG